MTETASVQAIAAQILDLKDTHALVLRLPPSMATSEASFQNFAAELRTALGEQLAKSARVIVLRSDMELESLDGVELERLGMRRSQAAPGLPPEELFPAGPLRRAAQAGWDSAFGRVEMLRTVVETAKRELEEEVRMQNELNVSTTSRHGSGS